MHLRNFFIARSFLFSSLLILSCCTGGGRNTSNQANLNFEEKFGHEAALINAERYESQEQIEVEQPQLAKKTFSNNPYDDAGSLIGVSGVYKNYSANVDTSKLKIKKPQNFTPDQQTLATGQDYVMKNKLPDDMFDLTYNTQPHPPFVVAGLEFEAIEIPRQDFYGINSTFNNKQYLLAGNEALQKNIENINKSRTQEDIDISESLIKEQKQLREHQKMMKIFKNDPSLVEKEKLKDKNSKEEKTAKMKKIIAEDPEKSALRKAIALQVIQQNLKQNPANLNQNQ